MPQQIKDLSTAKRVLDRHGFHFQKKYGQNFLLDVDLLVEIAASSNIERNDYVIEIGPGMGSLTARLARRAKKVVAIEIDGNLIPILKETLADYDNIEILHADVMKADLSQLIADMTAGQEDPTVRVVANLPYYITTPILMRLLEEGGASDIQDGQTKGFPYDSITVMVQREVAERMVCEPGSKDYGALSLAVQYYTSPEIVRYVPAEQFYPPPKVDSAVVHLIRYKNPPVEVCDEKLLFSLIRASFNQRRKTLVNGLYNGMGYPFSKVEYAEILAACGLPADVRGEKLSLSDFTRLTNEVHRRRVEK